MQPDPLRRILQFRFAIGSVLIVVYRKAGTDRNVIVPICGVNRN